MEREKRPFVGFSFGGFDFYVNGIYRVSNSGRYEIKTSPDVKITTSSMDGKDGLTMLSSYYQPKKFQIQIAFDNLNRKTIYDLQTELNSNEIKQLRFDEYNDRYWNAKVNGAFDLKYICFDSEYGDIYKGEGTINFIAYDPFAYSNDSYGNTINDGDVPAHFIMKGVIPENLLIVPWGAVNDKNTPKIKIMDNSLSGENFIWNSQTGLLCKDVVPKIPIKYAGNLLARIPVGVTPNPGVTYRKMYL